MKSEDLIDMSEEIILDDFISEGVDREDGYMDDSTLIYSEIHAARRVTQQQLCFWYLKYRILKFLCLAP